MAPSPRPPPPAWIGLVPVVAGALLLVGRDAIWPAWPLLGAAVGVVAILELVSSMTGRRWERQPELRPLTSAGVALARLVSVAVAALESGLAVAIGLQRLQAVPLVVGAGFLAIALATIMGVRRLSAALEAVRAAGHGNLVKGYSPIAYSNKDDPRIWVPKLGSVGKTLNFAHARSWLILAGFLALPAAALVLAFSSVLRHR